MYGGCCLVFLLPPNHRPKAQYAQRGQGQVRKGAEVRIGVRSGLELTLGAGLAFTVGSPAGLTGAATPLHTPACSTNIWLTQTSGAYSHLLARSTPQQSCRLPQHLHNLLLQGTSLSFATEQGGGVWVWGGVQQTLPPSPTKPCSHPPFRGSLGSRPGWGAQPHTPSSPSSLASGQGGSQNAPFG